MVDCEHVLFEIDPRCFIETRSPFNDRQSHTNIKDRAVSLKLVLDFSRLNLFPRLESLARGRGSCDSRAENMCDSHVSHTKHDICRGSPCFCRVVHVFVVGHA